MANSMLLTGITLGVGGCIGGEPTESMLAGNPEQLSGICSPGELVRIGAQYLQKFPNESSQEELLQKIIENMPGTSFSAELLEDMISGDYRADRTLVLDGWLISVTEARQCALFKLIGESN